MIMNAIKYFFAAIAVSTTLGGCSAASLPSTSTPANEIVTRQPSVVAPGEDIGKSLIGEWTIIKVGTTDIHQDENMPYINFSPAELRFYAFNGCNVLNGDYRVEGSTIVLSHVLCTQRLCPEISYDGDINYALREDEKLHISIKDIGNESYLYISDGTGHKLLTLRRHNMDFLNGEWLVAKIGDEDVDDEGVNIFFDISEKKVHGNSGCNYFNGDISMDPATANSINFTNMGVTRMACPNGDRERKMLVALEQTTTAIHGGSDKVLLIDRKGKTLLTLKRAPKDDM